MGATPGLRRPLAAWAVVLLPLCHCIGAVNAEASCRATAKLSAAPKEKPPDFVQATPDSWLPTGVLTAGTPHKDVRGCCRLEISASLSQGVSLTEDDDDRVSLETETIGSMPQFSTEQALQVLDAAVRAWGGGFGAWPQMAMADRCRAVSALLDELATDRDAIVRVLQWEIGKNRADAASEFDRTIDFCRAMIEQLRTDPEFSSTVWQGLGKTAALVRRAAIGVILCLGPYNYPLNETYAVLISSLLMGNIVILKIPTVGGLVHLLTLKAFQKTLPAGTVNFVAGSGRATMPPLMQTGQVDGLAFVGGSSAADQLIQHHPSPHRLKVFLQLEAKNMGVFLPDLFAEDTPEELLDNAIEETIAGTLSFNGQRCTALKILFVPGKHADPFLDKLVQRVEDMTVGLPWQTFGTAGKKSFSQITPLPNPGRVAYMQQLVQDAVQKGAAVMNRAGGTVLGGINSTLMVPAVLYPCTPDMKVYQEEQFGPVVPVVVYGDGDNEGLETVATYARDATYGQQVSLFGRDPAETASLLDKFSAVFARINLNAQCSRGPDTLPFSGRRSSAMGTMSVKEALREFSIPVVVAHKRQPAPAQMSSVLESVNRDLVEGLQRESNFLQPVKESLDGL